jgi:hypothetical protein
MEKIILKGKKTYKKVQLKTKLSCKKVLLLLFQEKGSSSPIPVTFQMDSPSFLVVNGPELRYRS